MNNNDWFYSKMFTVAVYTKTGQAFEDFFCEILKACDDDFNKVIHKKFHLKKRPGYPKRVARSLLYEILFFAIVPIFNDIYRIIQKYSYFPGMQLRTGAQDIVKGRDVHAKKCSVFDSMGIQPAFWVESHSRGWGACTCRGGAH